MSMFLALRYLVASTILSAAGVFGAAAAAPNVAASWQLNTLDTTVTVASSESGSLVTQLSAIGGTWNWASGGVAVNELPKSVDGG